MTKTKLRGLAGVLGALFSVGCVNSDVYLYEVHVRGAVSAQNLGSSVVHLEFHHAQFFGHGELAHPLGRFATSIPENPTVIDETILYPLDAGEGLVIYGWLDKDGDGVLCAPTQTTEPAGLIAVKSFPAHEVTFELKLDRPCAGSEALYP
ncbi:MAG TPA: hypothetical protein PKE31_16065 [Pseudomonadota bacterium]|nr:hypothetical protein [Pseudomonadota bacterium]